MSDELQNHTISGVDEGLASDESILKTHTRIRREPFFVASPVLFTTAFALIIVFIFGWFYQRRYMGEQNPQMYLHERTDIALYNDWLERPRGPIVYDYYAIGEKLYTTMACVGCHQANGEGLPGQFPPLAGSEYVKIEDSTLTTKVLLSGLVGPVTVKGSEYNGNMAAYGGLKDHEIAGIVTFIRKNWGNESSEVTKDDVAGVRDEIGSRDPWTAEELNSYFQ
ncbi:MAG: c-type cytochrome [Opitutales bacterium]